MNSKRKGNAGEMEVVHLLRDAGYDAHRNDQRYTGGKEWPDVGGVPGYHLEIKRTERFNLYDAMEQAEQDANGKSVPVVLHRRNKKPWASADFPL